MRLHAKAAHAFCGQGRFLMKFSNYDLCLITDEKERLYFLGFSSTDGYVVHSKEKTTLVIDKRYYYAAKKKLEPKGFDVVCGSDYTFLKEAVISTETRVLGIDFSVTTIKQLDLLKKTLPNIEFFDIGPELECEASIKNSEEIKAIAKACAIAEKSFMETLPCLEIGVTESDIAAELEYRFKKNGASDKSFDTIVAFGANSAVPHHQTGKTRLKANVPVLMDFGCVYSGYCSDMTRTVFFGSEPDEKFLRAYKAVYEAHFAALNGIKAGMTGKEADAFARNVLESYGYAQYFTHSLGHGIGVHIHEYPWLAPSKRAELCDLENGMVFSDEPGVYFDGKFGIRIEDSCYLKDGTLHTFMKEDKKLIVIDGSGMQKYIL